MRYVTSLPPVTTRPNTRQVRGLSQTHAIKPVQTDEQAVPNVENKTTKQQWELQARQQHQRSEPFEDRRKTCRRVTRQAVLVELRSGFDRRRRNLRSNDLVDHIDETV
jgi:hypothetical protein